MNAARRERLDAVLNAAREAEAARRSLLQATTDDVLVRLTGIPDAAIARRVAETPRVLRRLAPALEAHARNVPVAVNDDEPTGISHSMPDEAVLAASALMEPHTRSEADPRTVNMIACAIRFAATGDLPAQADIEGARLRFEDDAVTFGLAHRRLVPAWIGAIAGRRDDTLRQLALTCLACAGRVPHDDSTTPLDVPNEAARKGAAALAEAALSILADDGSYVARLTGARA